MTGLCVFLLCLFTWVSLCGFSGAQLSSSGVNMNNRRITPPRIAPSSQQQPLPRIPQRPRQPVFNQFAPSPAYLNAAFLAQRVVQLENEVLGLSSAMRVMSNNLRAGHSTDVTERVGRLQQDVQGHSVQIEDNQENVDRVSQEQEYIKNSNANMQKRMDRIEAKLVVQQKNIENIEKTVENLQQMSGVASTQDAETTISSPRIDKSELDALFTDISMLKSRMNDTDDIIEGYESYFQSFASNIDTLSQNTEGLLGDAAATFRTLRRTREDIHSIQRDVQVLQVRERKSPEGNRVPEIVNGMMSAINILNITVQQIRTNQDRQVLKLENLTASIEEAEGQSPSEYAENINYYSDDSQNESQMVLELATSVTGLEESIKKLRENQAISSETINLRLRDLATSSTTIQAAELKDFQTRIFTLEEGFTAVVTLQSDVQSLNLTATKHERRLRNIEIELFNNDSSPDPIQSESDIKENSNNPDFYFGENYEDINLNFSSSSMDDFITAEFLEQRLQLLFNNLTRSTNKHETEGTMNEVKQLQNSLRIQSSRLDGVSNLVNTLDERVAENIRQNPPSAFGFPIPTAANLDQAVLDQLRSQVETLNSSVSVQTSMLSQGIHAMGNFERRLRKRENWGRTMTTELQEIRVLMANATDSLSQMSLSVAKHELMIPSISESLEMEKNILLDLNQQMYDQEIALEKLNQTFATKSHQTDEGSPETEPLLARSTIKLNSLRDNDKINGHDTSLPGTYVTQSQFDNLADVLVGIAERAGATNELYMSLDARLNATQEVIADHSHDAITSLLHKIWKEVNTTKDTIELHQNVLASLSSASNVMRDTVNGLTRSIQTSTVNESVKFGREGFGNEFIKLLDASVRELRVDVKEQGKWIGNQRRRIRNLEDMQLQLSARQTDIVEINRTLTELRGIRDGKEAASPDLPSDIKHRNYVKSNQTANLTIRGASDSALFEKLQEEIAALSRRFDKYGAEKSGNIDANNTVRNTAFNEDIRTLPVTLRLLETQVYSFQEALQSLPQLTAKVETLNSMRNLVFQNARDITTFHQTVAGLEVDINGVDRKLSLIEFTNQRLDSYQDDIRLRVNNTRRMMDRLNDQSYVFQQKIRLLSRFLAGNTTELKDKVKINQDRLDNAVQTSILSSNRIENLEHDLQQQVSTESIRHNTIDTRIARNENRVENLQKDSSRKDDVITSISRSLAEEANTRRLVIADHNDAIQSLKQLVANLEARANSLQQVSSGTNNRLNELSEMRERISGEITQLQRSYQIMKKDIQDGNSDLVSARSDIDTLEGKLNNIEDDLSFLRTSSAAQSNDFLSIRQTLIAINDEVNSLQQSSQNHSAFVRRAGQTIDKHRTDIAFIFEHSSNHSVALEILKQRLGGNRQETYTNVTRELLSEMQLLDYNLQGLMDEVAAMKRQTSIRENSAVRLEGRLSEVAASVVEDEKNIQTNNDFLSRIRGDINRQGDRIRAVENDLQVQQVAGADLQQVVMANGDELARLSDLRSELNRAKEDFSKFTLKEGNTTRSTQRSINDLNTKVLGLTSRVGQQETILGNFRQDKISFQESIDQIFQSSSNLEELLRTTVSDLSNLKRDFDVVRDIRSAVPTLERRTSEIKSEIQKATQTINTNENKIERMQDLIERTSHSLNNINVAMRSQAHEDRTREHSRNGAMRNIVEKLSRTSTSLASVRNEVHQHNQRLHLLTRRVIGVDGKLEDFLSIAPQPHLRHKEDNLSNTLEDDDVFASSSSGWMETHSILDSMQDFNLKPLPNVSNIQEAFKSLSIHMLNISEAVDNLNVRVENISRLSAKFEEVLNSSVSDTVQSGDTPETSAVATVQMHLDNLTDLTGNLSFEFASIKSGMNNLSSKVNVVEEVSRNAAAYSQTVRDKFEELTLKTVEDLSEIEQTFSTRFLEQTQDMWNLTTVIIDMADDMKSLHVQIEKGVLHGAAREDVDDMRTTLNALETNVQNLVLRLHNVSSSISKFDSKSRSLNVHDILKNITLADHHMNAEVSDHTKLAFGNVSLQIFGLNETFERTLQTVTALQQKASVLDKKLLEKSAKNHSHIRVESEVHFITVAMRALQTEMSSLSSRLMALERHRAEAQNSLNKISSDIRVAIDRLSNRVASQDDILHTHNSNILSTNQRLFDLTSQLSLEEDELINRNHGLEKLYLTLDRVSPLLHDLAEDLDGFNNITWSLVNRTSQISVSYDDSVSYGYVETEGGIERTNVYESSDSTDYEQGEKLQDILQDTNRNTAGISSKLISTLRQISKVLAVERPPLGRERNGESSTSPSFGFIIEMNQTLTNILERLTTAERLTAISKERSVNNPMLDSLIGNMSYLSQAVHGLKKERITSDENQNVLTSLENEMTNLQRDMLVSNEERKGLKKNVSMLKAAVSSCYASNEIQEQAMNNIRLLQDTHSKSIRDIKNGSRDLSSKLSTSTEQLERKLFAYENRIYMRFMEEQEHYDAKDVATRESLLNVMDDLAALNHTSDSLMHQVDELQENIRSSATEREHIPILEADVENIQSLLQNLQANQQQQKTNADDVAETLLSFEKYLKAIEDNMSYLRLELELSNNQTQSLANIVMDASLSANAKLHQEIDSVIQLLYNETDEVTLKMRALEAQTDDKYDQLEDRINRTLQEKDTYLFDLQRTTEALFTAKRILEVAVMRHSVELRKLSTMIQEEKALLGTMSDSMTLNSNQVTFLTGQVLEGSARNFDIMFNLSQIIANHSLELERIENQISFLLSGSPSPSESVRIVIPTDDSSSSRRTTTTTRAPQSSTFPSSIPPPTDLSVILATPTEIVISWLPPSNFRKVEYRIIIQSVVNRYDVLQIAAVAPPVRVNGLYPATRYLIKVHSASNQELSRPISAFIETSTRANARPVAAPLLTTLERTTTALPTSIENSDTMAPDVDLPSSTNIHRADIALLSSESEPHTSVLHCDFDMDDICNFLNDPTADFNWTRHNGSTPSSETGPSRDHTRGTSVGQFVVGFYMFIEASRPRQSGDIARLLSPLFEPTVGHCVEFYYHMYGAGTGDLNVLVQRADGLSSIKVWSDTGNHGNQWKKAKVTVDSDYPFRLAFEAVRGVNYHADTAIDDVTIRNEPCPKPLVQCGFERPDLCGFTQDSDDDFDWERLSGATSSADTGPIADHTYGTVAGFYLYLEASNPRAFGDATRLSSRLLNPTAAQCLQFQYHMHGVDIGALNIYIRLDSNPTDLGSPIWTKSGPQGNEWLLGRTTMASVDSFQVVIEGVRGNDYHGDIAIDDITITQGQCDQPDCPIGVRFGNLCYKVEKNGRSYQNATDFCASDGGLLVSIKTQIQQDFVTDLISGEGNQWTLFWIGLDDRANEGHFLYSDKTALDSNNLSFNAWSQGEPNDSLGDEDCVNMEYATKHRLWNDVPCNRELWFICQYPISL